MSEESFTFEDLRALARDETKRTLKELGSYNYLEKIKEVLDNLKINAKTKRDILKIKKAEEYAEIIVKKRLERILLNIICDFVSGKESLEELRHMSEKERKLYNFIMSLLKKHLNEALAYVKGESGMNYATDRLVLVKVLEPVEIKNLRLEKDELALIPVEEASRLEMEHKVRRIERP
ncbi:MAG: hypothetical protein GXO42_00255 [bacterium]|nr:hypothetical protein [bacterium]